MTKVGTYGVMIEDGDPQVPFCLTLELPWLNNEPNKSCIPKGEYICNKTVSPSKGEVYEITGVPNRTNVLIHRGNFTSDSLGCVLVGEQFEDVLSSKADRVVTSIQASGLAFHELFKVRLNLANEFKLVIEEWT